MNDWTPAGQTLFMLGYMLALVTLTVMALQSGWRQVNRGGFPRPVFFILTGVMAVAVLFLVGNIVRDLARLWGLL